LFKSQQWTIYFPCKWLTSLLSSIISHLSDIRPLSLYKWLLWSSLNLYVEANVHSNLLRVGQRCTERNGIPPVVVQSFDIRCNAITICCTVSVSCRNCFMKLPLDFQLPLDQLLCIASHTTVAVLHIQYVLIYKIIKNVCWAPLPHTLDPCISKVLHDY
jgi:hypothetical protein